MELLPNNQIYNQVRMELIQKSTPLSFSNLQLTLNLRAVAMCVIGDKRFERMLLMVRFRAFVTSSPSSLIIPSGWLYRIVLNKPLQHLRRESFVVHALARYVCLIYHWPLVLRMAFELPTMKLPFG
jgi:hypothetical protein